MSLLDSLRMIFRVAAAAALLVVAEAGPSFMLGSTAGANRASDWALLDAPTLTQPGIPTSGPAGASTTFRVQNFARTPLAFEPNEGQTDAQVQYMARGHGYTLFLAATEAVLLLRPAWPRADSSGLAALRGRKASIAGSIVATYEERTVGSERAVLRMQLVGGNSVARARGTDRLPGIVNYFRGNDASKWRTHILTYARVQYQDVYPGIDLVYYGNQRQLEYDFVVGPGADPGQIRLRFAGAQSLSVDARGDLLVQAGGQMLVQHKPVVYQEMAGEQRQVAANFVVHGKEVSFALGSYDRSRRLVIDPVLSYSTYLGGSGVDEATGIAVDAAGNVYVTGDTTSPDFPTANPLQPVFGGGGSGNLGRGDAFVAKLTADGSALVYATYLGGSGDDGGTGIAVDSAGNAYVIGDTSSRDFPTVNALQATYGGNDDAFVAQLTADGSALIYSTYLGGSDLERGDRIAVDAAGNAYVTGGTSSRNFPTANPLQPAYGGGINNAFVAKLTADGSALVYSTYLGGSGQDRGFGIAVDAAGNACVTGTTHSRDFPTANALQPVLPGDTGNSFVAKLTADGSTLLYSTYLGGSSGSWAFGIALDAAGNAYVTGETFGPGFPTVNALQPTYGGGLRDAFVTKLTADGSAMVYSTYLGGSAEDLGYWQGIAVDAAGNAYVAGLTNSPDFPTVNALQPTYGGGPYDAFVTKLAADGSALVYSTYLGGSGDDGANSIAVDAAGNAHIAGYTNSSDFPTANPLQPTLRGSYNAFVAKISTVVTSGPATQLQVSAPAQVTSGTPFDVTVTALDANGLTAVGYVGTMTFSATDADPGVVLPADYTFTAGDQGMHTFVGGFTLITVGNQTVTATDTADPTITGNATVTVNPGP
jgi:hypothetical protein